MQGKVYYVALLKLSQISLFLAGMNEFENSGFAEVACLVEHEEEII
jgi:hypothetical protein